MSLQITSGKIRLTFSKALNQKKLINQYDNALVFIDLSYIEKKIIELKKAFPKTTIHTSAVKANPLVNIMTFIKKQGLGFEAASLPELYISQKTGKVSNKILFDSPAKTIHELEYALKAGVFINADSLDELERIDKILKRIKSKSKIGLRINPQVGMGKIKSTSVAGKYSKFGVPLLEKKKEIINAYQKYYWLSGIHLHIGSQGCTLQQLVSGVERVYNLAEEINSLFSSNNKNNKIKYFDIGGGLPVSYESNIKEISFRKYANSLKKKCPKLFINKYVLITEFGRHLFANSAWAVSRIEYIKNESNLHAGKTGMKTLMVHLGADMFVRECYNPTDWQHEFLVVNKNGNLLSRKEKSIYNIAGPLCFAGDIIGRNIRLSNPSQTDFLVIRDVGAYTFSMWSRYNSRQMPKIIGYFGDGRNFKILKEKESLKKLRNFWL